MIITIDVTLIDFLRQTCNIVRRFGYVSGKEAALQTDVSTRDRVMAIFKSGIRNNAEFPTPTDDRKAQEVLDWAAHIPEEELHNTHYSAINTLARLNIIKWHTAGLGVSMVNAYDRWKEKQQKRQEKPNEKSA